MQQAAGELAGKPVNFSAWPVDGDGVVLSIKTSAVTQRPNRTCNRIMYPGDHIRNMTRQQRMNITYLTPTG